MDFSNPGSERMQSILDGVGLAHTTVSERQRNQRLRRTLIARSLLFGMLRPVETRSPLHAYLHRAYAQAAFQGAPDLRDYRGSDFWLREMVPHLQSFAGRDEARRLIGEGVAAHYNRIADQTVKLPSSDEPWIPAYTTEEGVDPMALMGVIGGRMYSPFPRDEKNVRRFHRRIHLRIMGIAECIGWTIPGIETEETRTAILDSFEATSDTERAADPQMLFMAGRIAVEGTEVPMSEVFGA